MKRPSLGIAACSDVTRGCFLATRSSTDQFIGTEKQGPFVVGLNPCRSERDARCLLHPCKLTGSVKNLAAPVS